MPHVSQFAGYIWESVSLFSPKSTNLRVSSIHAFFIMVVLCRHPSLSRAIHVPQDGRESIDGHGAVSPGQAVGISGSHWPWTCGENRGSAAVGKENNEDHSQGDGIVLGRQVLRNGCSTNALCLLPWSFFVPVPSKVSRRILPVLPLDARRKRECGTRLP